MHGYKPLAATLDLLNIFGFFFFFFNVPFKLSTGISSHAFLIPVLFCFPHLCPRVPFFSSLLSPSSFSFCAHITTDTCCEIHVSSWPTGPCIAFHPPSRTSRFCPPPLVPRASASSLSWYPASCSGCLKPPGWRPAAWERLGEVAKTEMIPGGVCYRERAETKRSEECRWSWDRLWGKRHE